MQLSLRFFIWCLMPNQTKIFTQKFLQIFCCLAASVLCLGMSVSVSQAMIATETFDCKLFRQASGSLQKNTVISPFSAYQVLSMIANGAQGKTLKQMQQMLGGSGVDLNKLNQKNAETIKVLSSQKDAGDLAIANAIYADKSTPFKKSFLQLCRSQYHAQISNEDFKDPHLVDRINAWCSDHTHGKIPKIIQGLKPEEKMVLLNSVYFKGAWAKAFDRAATKNGDFKNIGGKSIKVPMMHTRRSMSYFADSKDGLQVCAIDYRGLKQRLLIFLPRDIRSFRDQMDSTSLKRWISMMDKSMSQEVELALPRFKLVWERDLSDDLKALGIAQAFGESADFGAMIQSPYTAWISRVVQKTYIDVNEEGTEAAAITAGMMGATMAAMPKEPVKMVVDRPFIFVLRDEEADQNLFIGSVVDLR
jgi:serine protease inhibitor